MRRLQLLRCAVLSIGLVMPSARLWAQPAFVNGVVIPGSALDATRQPGANAGRLGFFSDIYYDPAREEWWAVSDRGPGGGVLDYSTRVQRFTLDVNPITGRISHYVADRDHNASAGRQDNRGFEGLAITPDGKTLYAVLQDPLINEPSPNNPVSPNSCTRHGYVALCAHPLPLAP